MSDSPQSPPAPDAARLQALYQGAVAHLNQGRADLARDAVETLARALPQSPEVQYLVRWTAVIAFQWPASRSPALLAPRAPPAQSDIDLAAFHVALANAPSGIHDAVDYMEVLKLTFESARLKAPRARRILITDERTVVPEVVGADQVLRFPIDPRRLMFERMRVQEIYLGRREPRRASVLMDSDVVVNADPVPIFAADFDVGLTWRPDFADSPFNGGMIFVSPGDAGHRFFVKALECYEGLAADASVAPLFPRDMKAWWGDQFALAALVGHRAFAERQGDALAVDGLRVGFFPCERYNFTIELDGRYPKEDLRRKHFIHFKGNRKSMQAYYLERMRAGEL